MLVTEYGTYFYQVFSTYSIKPEDYYINTEFDNYDEFEKFILKLADRTDKYGIKCFITASVAAEDILVSLSGYIANLENWVIFYE